MQKILIVAGVLVVGGAAFLMIDERLSPLAVELSQSQNDERSSISRAYRTLLGMHAAEEDDAFEIGSNLIEEFERASANSSVLDEIQYSEYPDDRKLFVPSSDDDNLYCQIRDPGCLDRIVVDRDGRDGEIERLSKLVDRYSTYLSADDYRTEMHHFLNEPWPDYRYVFTASRMNIFAAFNSAEDGDLSSAMDSLLEESRLLRVKLVTADTLIQKVVTLALIRDDLEALAYIHSLYDATAMESIPFLTPDEIDFTKPLQNEFRLMSEIVAAMDSNPKYLADEAKSPDWLVTLAFRPNMIINTIAKRIDEQIALSQVEQADFGVLLDELDLGERRVFSIVPSVNQVILEFTYVDYSGYVGRAFDLNAKIALVNAQTTGKSGALENPYYPGEEVLLHEDELNVCMDGPLPDERNFRCLDIVGVPLDLVSKLVP